MGWKSSFVIIPVKEEDIKPKELLKKLDFENLKALPSTSFDDAMNPQDGFVYYLNYKGHIIICDAYLPLSFLDEKLSSQEQKLCSLFPNRDICALMLQSTVNFYAYVVTNGHKRIRVKAVLLLMELYLILVSL